jgi:CheY-like chemotaxis protein
LFDIGILLGFIGIFVTIIVAYLIYRRQKEESERQVTELKKAMLPLLQSTLEKLNSIENNSRRVEFIETSISGFFETMNRLSQIHLLNHKKILWVDDHPEWNKFERVAFEALGIDVTTSLSSVDALYRLKAETYDLLISDVFSDIGLPKGFNLLGDIQKENLNVPLVFYTGSITPDLKKKAENSGAFGIEDSPAKLFAVVIKGLLKS